jgi:hypothetical protein
MAMLHVNNLRGGLGAASRITKKANKLGVNISACTNDVNKRSEKGGRRAPVRPLQTGRKKPAKEAKRISSMCGAFRIERRSRFVQRPRRRCNCLREEELAIARAAGEHGNGQQSGAGMETRVHFPLAWIV